MQIVVLRVFLFLEGVSFYIVKEEKEVVTNNIASIMEDFHKKTTFSGKKSPERLEHSTNCTTFAASKINSIA